jgi:hypothetical protein
MTTTTYLVTQTDDGDWLHPAGSDFLFAFIDKSWPDDVKLSVRGAFTQALQMPNMIKAEVKATSGQEVLNGLYLLNQKAMTEAMNNVEGMAETTVDQQSKSGREVTATINAEFFAAVLAGMSGDIAPLMDYLTKSMGDLQAQVRDSTVTADFGTVIGTVSVEPELGVPTIVFRYVFSDTKTSDWFVSVPCGSAEKHEYNYSFTVVDYLYVKPAQS